MPAPVPGSSRAPKAARVRDADAAGDKEKLDVLERSPHGEAAAKAAAPAEAAPKRHKQDAPAARAPYQTRTVEKLDGVELCGDETWFADPEFQRLLQDSAIKAHAEWNLQVGAAVDEAARICPDTGPAPSAAAVLRLDGAQLGGFGEADIAYAYKQLSRVLHPDKHPNTPKAAAAFKRLTDAVAELQQGLTSTRAMLEQLCLAMGSSPVPERPERPQGALFAQATRLLYAVLGLSGEGTVTGSVLDRALPAFAASPVYGGCQALRLLSDWYDRPQLIDVFAAAPLRMAFDCSPKRLRAQFLCALNRTMLSEAKRHRDCVRGTWQAIMVQFPEMGLWRDFLDKVKTRFRASGEKDHGKLDDDSVPQTSGWATKWRDIMCAVLPSNVDGAASVYHAEVRKLAAALWRDVAEWARQVDAERHLALVRAEAPGHESRRQQDAERRAEWAFCPATDLLLLIGEGVVGVTVEGIFVNTLGHDTQSFADALAQFGKPRDKKERTHSSRDRREPSPEPRHKKPAEEGARCDGRDPAESFQKENGRRGNHSQPQKAPSRPAPARRERSRSRSKERRCRIPHVDLDQELPPARPPPRTRANYDRPQGRGGDQETGRVFVANLPSNIEESALERLFQKYGRVLGLKIIVPRYRRDVANAIIRFDNPAAANAAIEALHGKHEIRPRQGVISVKRAKPSSQWD
mmetsp:Transcript_120636/g.341753  ORF Transcript_120636/g.341753 Transcript_120636/m.341753 type:complete len:690 (-) Transcript_120636:15-2084(-)